MKAIFRHTNIVSRDWRGLARFYEIVFGCIPSPPERDYKGKWLENLTGTPLESVRGIHLLLPGHGDSGPTLEIFQMAPEAERPETAINRPGFAHIAFVVDDVEAALQEVLENGGGQLGEVISMDVLEAGSITLVYALDPEGNIVELQKWTRPE